MPIIDFNDLGIWINLGTVNPSFLEFIAFDTIINTSFSLFRLSVENVTQNDLKTITSKLYIRQLIEGVPINNWERIYIHPGIQYLVMPLPDEIKYQNINRSFELIKLSLYGKIGVNHDINYSVNLSYFTPYYIDNRTGLSDADKQYVENLLIKYIGVA